MVNHQWGSLSHVGVSINAQPLPFNLPFFLSLSLSFLWMLCSHQPLVFLFTHWSFFTLPIEREKKNIAVPDSLWAEQNSSNNAQIHQSCCKCSTVVTGAKRRKKSDLGIFPFVLLVGSASLSLWWVLSGSIYWFGLWLLLGGFLLPGVVLKWAYVFQFFWCCVIWVF